MFPLSEVLLFCMPIRDCEVVAVQEQEKRQEELIEKSGKLKKMIDMPNGKP
jgi:hypothetical protein